MSTYNFTPASNSGSTQWAADGNQDYNNDTDNITDNATVVADAPVGAEASQGSGGAGSNPRAAEETQSAQRTAPAPSPKWGTGYLVALMFKIIAIMFLGIRAAIIVAPAVRVGLSWARFNLYRVYDIATIGCVVGLIV